MSMNITRISNETAFGKVLRAPLRLIPRGTPISILQGPLRGKRWVVGSSTHGCWLGLYERDKARVFEQSIRPGSVVYDIGAHVGYYTLIASKLVGSEGRVIAFEPVSRNLEYLREHVRMNGAENVTIMDAAVAEHEGRSRLETGPSSYQGRLSRSGELEVRTVSLDELVSHGLPGPRCIKMDIEGGELAALRGAIGVLRESKPVIFLSTHGKDVHKGCCELLKSAEYELRQLGTPDELLASPA
jgi:FkbM family methyltransferase